MTWELLKPPTISVTTRIAIASIAEVLLCQFGSKGPGITEFLSICLNTSRVFSVEIPRKRANKAFLFFFWRVFVNLFIIQSSLIKHAVISPLFKVVESYFIKLVWTFHLYFFQSGVLYFVSHPATLGFTGSLSTRRPPCPGIFPSICDLDSFFCRSVPLLGVDKSPDLMIGPWM